MSEEQSFDASLVEQTKTQIRTLIAEIQALSKTDMPAEEFYAEFLKRVVQAMAAVGGVVWLFGENGGLTLQAQINLRDSGLRADDDKEKMAQHSRLLYSSVKHPEGMLVPPHSSSQEDQGLVGNPTGNLLVLTPLITDIELVGLIEIFQRADAPVNTQRGYLRFLNQMAEMAVEFIKNRQLRHFSERQLMWNQLEEFVRTIHESLDPRATAYTIANEGRRLIECDRVSIAIRYGRRCRVEAVSGQDLFDKRSNTIRYLNKLSTAVVAVEEPMWYTGDTSNFAPQVEKAVEEYVDESHSKMVAVIPLIPPVREEDKEDKTRAKAPPKPLGALIVEQIENSAVQNRVRQRVDVVASHSCGALANSLEHDRLFLMPLWRAIGRLSWVIEARTLPKTISIGVLLLILFIGMFIFPYRYEVEAEGKLMPVRRHEIYAKADGDVEDVLVRHGQKVEGPQYRPGVKLDESGNPMLADYIHSLGKNMSVVDPDIIIEKKGTPLVKLKNTDLSTQRVKLIGDIQRTEQEISSISQILFKERNMTPEERIRQQGRLSELQRQVETYRAEEFLLRIKEKNMTLYSPCDGVVVTFDVRETLMDRPIQRGQVVMEVADPQGEWQLELYMPERRIGAITLAQNQFKDKFPEGLPVTYILASHPEKKLRGHIKEIHRTAEVRPELGNVILVKVAINKEDIQPHIGATVNGKIYCGVRPIGYVWFSDAIAFVRSKILFKWF